ncbi:MAG: GNAT family N-acetyltransferase [Acidobacteria bacterium]|nr:GNAT family N-acetyltransferase [Acidobacteriota bacterium]
MAVRLIDRLSDRQVDELCDLYEREWWSRARTREDVRRMLTATDFVFAFEDEQSGELVAFCRVLTDTVYRAHLFDVIVKESHRGQGLGQGLMDAVVAHPVLGRVEKVILSCRTELVPFYAGWGFTTELGPDIHFMVRPGTGVGAA